MAGGTYLLELIDCGFLAFLMIMGTRNVTKEGGRHCFQWVEAPEERGRDTE